MNTEHDTAAALNRLQTHLPELLQYFVVEPTDAASSPQEEDAQ